MLLHIIFGALYVLCGVLMLIQYKKASPATGHVVILFYTCVFIALMFFHLDIYLMIERINNR